MDSFFPKSICTKVNSTNTTRFWTQHAGSTFRADNRHATRTSNLCRLNQNLNSVDQFCLCVNKQYSTLNICKQFKEIVSQLHYENLTKTFTKTETLPYFLPVPEIFDRALVKAGISHADFLSQTDTPSFCFYFQWLSWAG